MKKIFITITLCVICMLMLNAVPAYPGLMTIVQSDGTEISYYLKGDENFHFMVTEDGYLLATNKRGILEYARMNKKLHIKPIGVKARNIGERTKRELKRMKKADTIESIIDKIKKEAWRKDQTSDENI